jgi:1-acyl-sn-glycerol-3-phosphate acyltransferase
MQIVMNIIDRYWHRIPPSLLRHLEWPVAYFLAWLARAASGAQVVHRDYEPSVGQRLYYFNHTSHADSVLLWAVLPPDIRESVRMVAAEDYWTSSPLRRYVAERVFHATFVNRTATAIEDRQLQVQRILEGLGASHSLIFSPEGTRGDGAEVQPFKSGLYYLCKARPELQLVPVYLENLNRLLPKGEFIPLPLLCRVSFGKPIQLQSDEAKGAFLERARQALVDLGTGI